MNEQYLLYSIPNIFSWKPKTEKTIEARANTKIDYR